jgi:hypothetical protein
MIQHQSVSAPATKIVIDIRVPCYEYSIVGDGGCVGRSSIAIRVREKSGVRFSVADDAILVIDEDGIVQKMYCRPRFSPALYRPRAAETYAPEIRHFVSHMNAPVAVGRGGKWCISQADSLIASSPHSAKMP